MDQDDPLLQIAESLAKLERLYAEDMRLREEQNKVFQDGQKEFDERQKTWDKQNEDWKKVTARNPWLQPERIGYFLVMLALLVLSITVFLLASR